MASGKNNVSLDYRCYEEQNHDTDFSVNMNADNVDDAKLCKLLNTWLKAIDSRLIVTDNRNA